MRKTADLETIWQVFIFLHYVLDDWFVNEVEPRMKGKCFLSRFADDFIIGCQLKSDAERLMEVLPKRFDRFKLSLHPEKTQMIQFGRPSGSGKGRGTFDFLGFTFYWSRSRNGYWVIKKKTARKRLNLFKSTIHCRYQELSTISDNHAGSKVIRRSGCRLAG